MPLQIVNRPAITVIGMEIHTQPMSPDIPALWPTFVARLSEIEHPLEPQVSYGVMRHDGSMTRLDYMAAVSVRSADEPLPPGMVRLTLPAGPYAFFSFPLSGLGAGFGEIFERALPASDHQQAPGPYFERYNEAFDPGNPNSAVEIYLPVKPKGT